MILEVRGGFGGRCAIFVLFQGCESLKRGLEL